MKRFVLFLIVIIAAFSICGCSKNNKSDDGWTYEEMSERFGGVISDEFKSIRDCLNTLSWNNYHIEGYITEINYSDILIADSLDEVSDRYTVSIFVGEEYVNYNIGDYVYISAESPNKYLFGYEELRNYNLKASSNYEGTYVSSIAIDDDYSSVYDSIILFNKIYEETQFKTEGVIYAQDNYYYLYPSDKSKSEDPYLRIRLILSDDTDLIIGENVSIVGNPVDEFFGQALRNVYITKN